MSTQPSCSRCGKPIETPVTPLRETVICPTCRAEVSPAPGVIEAVVIAPPNPEAVAPADEIIKAVLVEQPHELAWPEEDVSDADGLELGPSWRNVSKAFAMIRVGILVTVAGLVCHMVAELPLLGFIQVLLLGTGGLALFVGQILCLRVPAGTRARSTAYICLAARVSAFGLTLYVLLSRLNAAATGELATDQDVLIRFALLLTAWIASVVAEFFLLATIKRVGLFLEEQKAVRVVRWMGWILAAYAATAVILGTIGVVLAYQSVLRDIAIQQARFPMGHYQPRTWLLARIGAVLSPQQGESSAVSEARFAASAVTCGFWLVLGLCYWDALSRAITAIRRRLPRRRRGRARR